MQKSERVNFGSKIGAVLAAAGSAVGLGNIWRFPYETGNHGGAAFILVYLACVFMLGMPIMIAEFTVGRHSKASTGRAYKVLAPGTHWKWLGYLGVLAGFLILGYYSVVAGWTLEYILEAGMNGFADKKPEDFVVAFQSFSKDPVRPLIWLVIFLLATHFVIVKGVKDGIEKSSKVLMPVLFILIGDMMSAYPSESYGIIFGSHGSGWLPTITGTRSIGQDGGRYSSDTALIPELAEVLRTVNPQKFDFVLFDACMMGCAEVYYELKDAARYCIASVLDIPAAGFPYASVMPYLYENAIKDYLGPICKDYIDYYNYNGWGTISAVDCNQMEGLAEAVRSVILSNQDSLKNVDTADLQQYGKGSSNFKGYAYDMLQFIEKLCGGMAPDDFTQQLKKTVVYTGYTHDPTSSLYRIDGDNYSGMGMYIPNSFTTPKYLLWNNYFKSSIAWYHAPDGLKRNLFGGIEGECSQLPFT